MAIIYALVALHEQDLTPARRPTVHQAYKDVCEIIDLETKSVRTIHRHLGELNLNAFIEVYEQNAGPQREELERGFSWSVRFSYKNHK